MEPLPTWSIVTMIALITGLGLIGLLKGAWVGLRTRYHVTSYNEVMEAKLNVLINAHQKITSPLLSHLRNWQESRRELTRKGKRLDDLVNHDLHMQLIFGMLSERQQYGLHVQQALRDYERLEWIITNDVALTPVEGMWLAKRRNFDENTHSATTINLRASIDALRSKVLEPA